MFDWFYKIFGTVMTWCYNLTNSYALALLLFALIIKVLMLPFGIKQQKSQIAMAKLRPKTAAIEKKYAGRNDKASLQKKQQEIMEMQQKEGYSALSGCLPLLIQMPIIIGLYSVIRKPLSYICKLSDDAVTKVLDVLKGDSAFSSMLTNASIKNDQISMISALNSASESTLASVSEAVSELAPGFDISSVPNFTMFGLDLAAKPSFTAISWLVLIPILAGVSSYLSMWLTRKFGGNPQTAAMSADQKKSMALMDIMMPAMSLGLAFTFPAALGLYWVYQSVIGVGQTLLLSKAMPLPKYTDEEIRQMEKAQKAQKAAQKAALSAQPRVKSLHHIDDDDYDTLPEVKNSDKAKHNTKGSIELGDFKDK